jgi:nitronate monooxygenase
VPYCIALALTNAKKGDLENGYAFAGANVYLVDKIISVKELIETLVGEYMAVEMQRPIATGMTSV